MNKIIEILKYIDPIEISGQTDKEIVGIHFDSREIEQEYLFVAVPGNTVDGHNYIEKAIENGAMAVVCEHIPESIPETGTRRQIVQTFCKLFHCDPMGESFFRPVL